MKKSLLALSILLSTSVMADYKIIISGNSGTIKLPESPEPQTDFVSHTFTSCEKEGRTGPSLSQCQSAYSGTELLSGDYGYTVNQGIQSFIVPETGDYKIKAYGPRGVNKNNNVGKGAIMEGVFSLNSGERIQILVGQFSVYNGDQFWQGGSGGTFVALGESNSSASPLVVAGGGGTNRSATSFVSTMNASTGTSGNTGKGVEAVSGGVNGNGAIGGHEYGGGGSSGFYGNGAPSGDLRNIPASYSGSYAPSMSFVNGGSGGEFETLYDSGNPFHGAFGGGSSGGWGGAGGAGGYSGGGNSGNGGESNIYYSGGGGSFISADAKSAATSDGNFQITGNEPTAAYTGPVQNIGSFNSSIGRVVIQKL